MNTFDPDESYLDHHHGEGPDDWCEVDGDEPREMIGQRDIFGGEVAA